MGGVLEVFTGYESIPIFGYILFLQITIFKNNFEKNINNGGIVSSNNF